MQRHHITLSTPVSKALRAQVKSGRYKDFSAAVQDAAWKYFMAPRSIFQEYGVSAEEVEAAAARDHAEIQRARRAGAQGLPKPADEMPRPRKEKRLDYPNDTEGSHIAAETRRHCNKLTPEERRKHLPKAMSIVYGGDRDAKTTGVKR